MRFDGYILSEGRSTEIGLPEAITAIKENCQESIKANRVGNILYRGVSRKSDAMIIYPSKSVRVARDGPNAYTLVIDNSPRWKAYPKRSRSIICTDKLSDAKSYGTAYRVFVKDGSRFGIAPSEDIWFSFFKHGGSSITEITDVFNNMSRAFQAGIGIIDKKSPSSYPALTNMFDKFDKYWKDNDMDFVLKGVGANYITDPVRKKQALSFNISQKEPIFDNNWMVRFYKGSMLEAWEKFLDPDKNGFKVVKGHHKIDVMRGHEIWTDGDSYLIDESLIDYDIRRELGISK